LLLGLAFPFVATIERCAFKWPKKGEKKHHQQLIYMFCLLVAKEFLLPFFDIINFWYRLFGQVLLFVIANIF